MNKKPERTIVIVEDEQDTAEMFAEMMHACGFRVLKAFNGAPAIALIAREKPAAVILDIMLPDISGLEVVRYMRNEPKLSKIPVVVVSSKSTPTDIKTGLEAGVSIYLTKPVGYLDLKEAVEKALAS